MKKAKTFALFFIASVTFFAAHAQQAQVVINEAGLYPTSDKKYIELLVVGDQFEPGVPIDLAGWKVNVASIQYNGLNAYIEFGNCFGNINPGTLILLYNPLAPPNGISPANDGFSDDNSILQLPLNHSCLFLKAGSYNGNSNVLNASNSQVITRLSNINPSVDAIQVINVSGDVEFAYDWQKPLALVENQSPNTVYLNPNINSNTIALNSLLSFCYETVISAEVVLTEVMGSPGSSNNDLNEVYVGVISSGPEPLQLSCGVTSHDYNSEGIGGTLIEISGGTPPYQVSLDNLDGTNIAYGFNSQTVHYHEDIDAGIYLYTVTDDNGCEKSCEVTIYEIEEQKICAGECVSIGEDLDEGLCYYWSPEEQLQENSDRTQRVQTVCPTEDVIYDVIVTDDNGNILFQKEYEITVHNGSLEISPEPAILCPNESITLNAGEGYSSYIWSTGETTSSIDVASQGIYSVTATSSDISDLSNEACTAVGEIEVIGEEDSSELDDWFLSKGFKKYEIQVLGPILSPPTGTINDYANLSVLIDGQETNIKNKVIEYHDILTQQNEALDQNISYEGFITSSACGETSLSDIYSMFKNSDADVRYWFHIWDRANNQDILYVIAESGTEDNSSSEEDIFTWGGVNYLFGGIVPRINYYESDYFSTDGQYLGSGYFPSFQCESGKINIVDMSGVDLSGMSQEEKVEYYRDNYVASFNEFPFLTAGSIDGLKKIMSFYLKYYIGTENHPVIFKTSGNNLLEAKFENHWKGYRFKDPQLDKIFLGRYRFNQSKDYFWIRVRTNPGGYPNIQVNLRNCGISAPTDLFNCKANLISMIAHENAHVQNDWPIMLSDYPHVDEEVECVFQHRVRFDDSIGGDISKLRHLNVAYFKQVIHPSFSWIDTYLKNDIECNINSGINAIEDNQLRSGANALFAPFFQ